LKRQETSDEMKSEEVRKKVRKARGLGKEKEEDGCYMNIWSRESGLEVRE